MMKFIFKILYATLLILCKTTTAIAISPGIDPDSHMKFLGINIDGTISTFQNKLALAGFLFNEYESNSLPIGQVQYEGRYNSHDADLIVYYNRKTSTVYKIELSLSFDSIEDVQLFTGSCMNEIEKEYTYLIDHKLDDPKSRHYCYRIMQEGKTDILGTIDVNPTFSYFINEKGEIVGESPTIIIVYEDYYNSSLLSPSTTEPSVPLNLIKSDTSFFNKNYEWAMNYKKNHCYQNYKLRLDWVMNCYKYNYGVPVEFMSKEEEIEREINSIDLYKFCKINTCYRGGSVVYRFVQPQTKALDFIVYELGGLGKYIKLNSKQIEENIKLLEKLIELYKLRKVELLNEISRYRSEKLNLLPVTYGEEIFSEGFGCIRWRNLKLSVTFTSSGDGVLDLEISHDYFPIMSFKSVDEIIEYRDSLKRSL